MARSNRRGETWSSSRGGVQKCSRCRVWGRAEFWSRGGARNKSKGGAWSKSRRGARSKSRSGASEQRRGQEQGLDEAPERGGIDHGSAHLASQAGGEEIKGQALR